MSKSRFKIDLYDSCARPFGLYFAVPRLFGVIWKHLDAFETQDKAKELYEKVKDLPEYLP